MNTHIFERRHPLLGGNEEYLLHRGVSADRRKLEVEGFLDRLGIPHLKDEIPTEAPKKKPEAMHSTRKLWLFAIAGIALGIGITTPLVKWATHAKSVAYTASSFLADYEWDGFRRVMPMPNRIR